MDLKVSICRDVSLPTTIDSLVLGVHKLMEGRETVDLRRAARGTAFAVLSEVLYPTETHEARRVLAELAVENRAKWSTGRTLNVFFMGDPLGIKNQVLQFAQEWSKYANIGFKQSTLPSSDIRISFGSLGSWSLIGTDSRRVSPSEATMNFGDFDANSTMEEIRATVLHEFGHALGCIHEHQSPAAGIRWNTAAVYSYYGDPAIGWSKKQIKENVLDRYATGETTNSRFDSESIMLYPIPVAHTLDGFSSSFNAELSRLDKATIQSLYP
jgi:serralysin